MCHENFIPNKGEQLDSDDDSSINGDFGNVANAEMLSSDLSDPDIPDIVTDSPSDEDIDSDFEDLHDSSESENDLNDAKDEVLKNETSKQDDSDSDCETSDSEEASATFQDIFGTEPNIEANRNSPPTLKTDCPSLDLCFHPENELLAAGSMDGDSVIYRYSTEKVEEVTRFSYHKKSCRQVCYNYDGSLLYTVSKDKSLAIIDIEKGDTKRHIQDAHDAAIYSFCEVDDNVCATGDDDGTVKIWDLRKPKPILEYKCGEETITSLLSCEGSFYLSATVADGSVTAFHLKKNLMDSQSELFDSEFTCQSLIRSNTRLVVGSGTGDMHIFKWGEFGYKVDTFPGHPNLIQCQTPITNNIVITGCEDGRIRAVHLYDHRFIGVVGQHKDFGIENLAVSCDGYLLASCSMDDEIQFWNIEYLYNNQNLPKIKKSKSFKKKISKRNLPSSRARNPRDFFKDLPRKVESEDEELGPVPGTSQDSD